MALKVAFVLGIGTVALRVWPGRLGAPDDVGAAGACEGVPADARGGMAGAGAAMMAAMWAYNGWNEMTYVAGEVRDPGRTLPRGLIGGLSIVAFLYVFVNATYFYVLTPAEVASVSAGSTVATEVVTHIFGQAASSLLAGLFVVSVFSSLQVTSMLCARVPYAMAQQGLFFAPLARLSPRTQGAHPRAGGAGSVGERARGVRLVRHAHRLRDVCDPRIRRDGHRLGVRVPAPMAGRRAARIARGATR